MSEAQQQDVAQGLQDAVMGATLPSKQDGEKRKVMRTPDGRELPAGRPKGTPNKVTRTIREAVELAAKGCHPQGLAGWLIDRANGTIQDRQIFAAMVNKAMPLQVQANVDGGIRLELGWLSGRTVGASAAQSEPQRVQVVDLERDSEGKYRIADPASGPASPAVEGAQEISDPPPPHQSAGGGQPLPEPLPPSLASSKKDVEPDAT